MPPDPVLPVTAETWSSGSTSPACRSGGGGEGHRGGETPGMRDPPGSSAGVVPRQLRETAGELGEEVGSGWAIP